MKITTLDIVKFLPLGKDFQAKLLEKFDKMNPDQKFALEQIIWDAYEAIYKLKLEENIKLALLNTKESNVNLDENFYRNIKAETVKQIESGFYKSTADADISQIRKKLEELIKG
ncbi:MAG: hypothetical protein UR89_C0050G0003 [Candidatus Roizmanbacteria bacterium GW2011_GWA2_35_8]|uniref:Uncharacterized protein n=1 Tax=Candidatus Roizmanbacteria bacterium GW2011_GWA2_35_8 TaxID=1618479 RepID=A0A0G0DAC7_9BACT|nr:MAG: hypothetical protein UR89_C0050G0003 [Candidatus Roizmanbacteria bacterium GW2011_GWA2_35_8]